MLRTYRDRYEENLFESVVPFWLKHAPEEVRKGSGPDTTAGQPIGRAWLIPAALRTAFSSNMSGISSIHAPHIEAQTERQ